MLEKLELQDEQIATCLRNAYGVNDAQAEFLPLGVGADLNTAVYCVVYDDETPYFLKLRSGAFESQT